MLISKDTANCNEDGECEHKDVENDAERFLANIGGKIKGDEHKNSGDGHGVTGREGRLAGTVGAGI